MVGRKTAAARCKEQALKLDTEIQRVAKVMREVDGYAIMFAERVAWKVDPDLHPMPYTEAQVKKARQAVRAAIRDAMRKAYETENAVVAKYEAKPKRTKLNAQTTVTFKEKLKL